MPNAAWKIVAENRSAYGFGRDQAVAALVPPLVVGALGPAAFSALSFLVSRLRLREAALRCIVPLTAIRSMREVSLRSSVSALAKSPAVVATVKALVWSFSNSLRNRLRARRLAPWRIRLFADSE